MYRLYFCPLWRRDRAEAYCERMEAQGYRLEKVLFSCLYRFREAPARGGSYVFLYSFPKDADLKYFDMEKELCTTFRGMQICGKGLFEEEVFRITVKNEELPYLLRTRDVFIRRGLIQRILISAFFSAIFLVFILPSDSRFLTGFAACTLAYLVYHLTGLVLLTQHMRKNEKQKF